MCENEGGERMRMVEKEERGQKQREEEGNEWGR